MNICIYTLDFIPARKKVSLPVSHPAFRIVVQLTEYYMALQEWCLKAVTEYRNGLNWKGPLEAIWFKLSWGHQELLAWDHVQVVLRRYPRMGTWCFWIKVYDLALVHILSSQCILIRFNGYQTLNCQFS